MLHIKKVQSAHKITDLTEGKPLPVLLRFALPLIIGNLFQSAYSIVDRIIVGQFVGAEAFSAVGATYAPSNMFASICIGMSAGAGIVVAQYFGAEKKEGISKAIQNSVFISFILAIITSIIGVFAAEPLLNILHTPENLMTDATAYMQIYLGGLVAVSAYYTPFSIIRSLGDSRTPLIFLVVCSFLNIFLDIFFVGTLKMGAAGAAIATIVAQSISAISCIVYAFLNIEYIKPAFHHEKLDRIMIFKTVRVSFPVSIQYALMYLSTVIMQSVVNSFGSTVIGAYTAVSQMELLVLEIYNGISTAFMTYTGQNVGAENYERIKSGLKAVTKICSIFALALFLLFWIGNDRVMGIFVSDAEITNISVTGIHISSLFFIACGMNRIMLALLNSAGDTAFSLINGVTEILSRVILIFFLTKRLSLGYYGIFLTTGLTWLISACSGILRYKQGKWKNRRIVS